MQITPAAERVTVALEGVITVLMVLILIRLIIAGVLLVAGVAKLFDLAGSKKAMSDFGLPGILGALLGTLLPVVEVIVGIALIPAATVWYGALGSLMLLLVFIAGISINLALGRKPDCHCFGQLHNSPIGPSTLIRNSILAAMAAILVGYGRHTPAPSIAALLSNLTASQIASLSLAFSLVMAIAVLGWFVFHLSRQNGRLLLRLEALEARIDAAGLAPVAASRQGIAVGIAAPSFELPDMAGNTVSLDMLRRDHRPILLIFSDPNCGPCNALMPDIAGWQRQHPDKLTVALISRGKLKENQSRSVKHGLTHVLLQKDREVSDTYQVNGTPGAVLVRGDGAIGSYVAMGNADIRSLVEHLLRNEASSPEPSPSGNGNRRFQRGTLPASLPVLKTGDPAPEIQLPDLSGKQVDLKDYLGQRLFILFWNPGCGYCQRMLPDVKRWESQLMNGAPKLVVISSGTVEANRAMGLQSTILLDQTFAAAQKFGSGATPSAVLINAAGKIQSGLVIGAVDILKLMASKQQHPLSATRMSLSPNPVS